MDTKQLDFVSRAICTFTTEMDADVAYWLDGFLAFAEGQPLEDMPSKQQQKGWWAACDAKAHTDMTWNLATKEVHELSDAEIVVELEDLQEDIEDRAWWSRGGW